MTLNTHEAPPTSGRIIRAEYCTDILAFLEMGHPFLLQSVGAVVVEQMAILEPALVESTMATCIAAMREAMDRAVELGVPEQAVRDFCPGHIRTLTAVAFGFAGFPASDGAIKVIEQNHPRIFHDDWKEVVISLGGDSAKRARHLRGLRETRGEK